MADVPANRLDPGAIEARSFENAFRGYDPTEVRTYLKGIADALRREARESSDSVQAMPAADAPAEADAAVVSELEATVAELQSEIERLQSERDDLAAKLETAETARSEAEDRLESSATEDDAELDEARMTQLLGEETTRVLDSARTAAANIRARAEEEAAQKMAELEAIEAERLSAIASAKEVSDAEIAALTAAAAEAATNERETAEADALQLRAEADTAAEAARVAADEVALAVKTRAEEVAKETRLAAEADAEAARHEIETLRGDATADAARIRAEAEADASTSQDAAREEARQMLTEAQSLREKVLGDLVEKRRVGRHQLDQAKAARDRLARSLAAVRSQLDESIGELDLAVPEARRAMEDAPEAAPVDTEREAQALATELDTARGAGIPIPGTPVAAEASDSVESTEADEPAVDAEPTGTEEEPLDGDPEEEEEPIEVPAPLQARDVALTRNGAGLRRQFKRALADDQSDVLDRLRQKRRKLTVEDLPDERSQLLRYIDAIEPALTAMANEGAVLAGGATAPSDEVDALIERSAATVIESFRSRIEVSVVDADDADDVLEPIRAHYRETRSSVLPELTEDALHEAFAIGVYSALADGAELSWMSDPRHETAADCHDNTLETVIKPATFPAGQQRPLGSPGCRCLVIATSMVDATDGDLGSS